ELGVVSSSLGFCEGYDNAKCPDRPRNAERTECGRRNTETCLDCGENCRHGCCGEIQGHRNLDSGSPQVCSYVESVRPVPGFESLLDRSVHLAAEIDQC